MTLVFFSLTVLVPIMLLTAGIMLIRSQDRGSARLWLGIGCLMLFALSLPVFLPALVFTVLLVTGGNFGG